MRKINQIFITILGFFFLYIAINDKSLVTQTFFKLTFILYSIITLILTYTQYKSNNIDELIDQLQFNIVVYLIINIIHSIIMIFIGWWLIGIIYLIVGIIVFKIRYKLLNKKHEFININFIDGG